MGHLGIIGAMRSTVSREMSTYGFCALVAAGYFPDLLDILFSHTGICSPYGLYTHTLPSVALQMGVCGGIAWLGSRSARLAILTTLVILLHSFADYPTARKLFMPGGEMHGLRIYSRPAVDFLLELSVLVAGWLCMRRARQGPRWATSVYVLASAIVLQLYFDVYVVKVYANIKPNACFHETNPIT